MGCMLYDSSRNTLPKHIDSHGTRWNGFTYLICGGSSDARLFVAIICSEGWNPISRAKVSGEQSQVSYQQMCSSSERFNVTFEILSAWNKIWNIF
jgi:hypothetical protein